MPFLHANLHHILSNTFPLFILLVLLAGSKARSWEIVVDIVLLGGALLWLFGRPGDVIGASGLIFGLIAFLILSGFWKSELSRSLWPSSWDSCTALRSFSGSCRKPILKSPGTGISGAAVPGVSWPTR